MKTSNIVSSLILGIATVLLLSFIVPKKNLKDNPKSSPRFFTSLKITNNCTGSTSVTSVTVNSVNYPLSVASGSTGTTTVDVGSGSATVRVFFSNSLTATLRGVASDGDNITSIQCSYTGLSRNWAQVNLSIPSGYGIVLTSYTGNFCN